MSVANRKTLTTRVHQHLMAQIAAGKLLVGSHVNATVVAEMLEVSRTTVRKAIDQLIDEGYVEIDDAHHPIVVKASRRKNASDLQSFDTANQTEKAYRSIYEKVLRRECQPGDTIRAQQLVEEFGVSLVTIRQALDWLCRDGVFLRLPRRGWQLALPTASEIRDIYRCRLALEPLAIQDAVLKITDEQIEQLSDQCRQLFDTAADLPEYERLDIDMKFHLLFVQMADSRVLTETITPLLRKRLTFSTEFVDEHQPHTFAEEHLLVLKGVQQRDASAAISAMKAHLNRALKTHTQRHA